MSSKVGINATPSGTAGNALNVDGGDGGAYIARFARTAGGTDCAVEINGGGGGGQVKFIDGANEWAIGGHTDNSFRIADNASIGTTDRLTIDSAGNVGIGGSPTSESSVARYLYIGDTASAGIVLDDTNSTPWDIYNVQGSLYFAPDSGAAKVTITSAGHVKADQAIGAEDATYSCMLYPNYSAGIAGFNLNAASNGFGIWDNTVERFKIDNAGLATFSNGIAVTTGGVAFPATQSASADANTLDDYEEGTWSPVYSSGSGAFATMTIDYVGPPTYTRIGRQVTVTALFRTNNVDATGASGALMVSGRPFAAAASNYSAANIGWASGFASDTPISGYTYGGVANIYLVERSAVDGNVTDCAVDSLTTGASTAENTIYLSATYFA